MAGAHCNLPAFHVAIPVDLNRSSISHPVIPAYLVRKAHVFNTKKLRRSELPSFHGLQSPRHPRCSVEGWNTLSKEKFDTRMAGKSLSLCFVGMSNCGKSHWSRTLENSLGFHVLSVDQEIERAIEPELVALGYSGCEGLAAWMGFPSEERNAKNQATYLAHEESITAAARPIHGSNSVLDTTGSVIYLDKGTIARIRQEYLVVHLEASDDMLESMTENYFNTPKPVVWGDAYRPIDGETANESLRRCYPNLLRERRKRYDDMSHLTVPASITLSRSLDLEGFLKVVRERL